ncbi:MAG: homoserine dehydrogenase [Armatimonadota bacterium]
MNREQVNIGILGFGVVGGGAYHVLNKHAEAIAARVGTRLAVTKVADSDWQRDRPGLPPAEVRTDNSLEVVRDPEVDIVVECIGGVRPAKEYILEAIRNGKNVVTSNKELMAKHGSEILDAAKEAQVDVEFEGSAGGVIPVVRALKESLEGNRIEQILGILNGTTNYILTRMADEGLSFDEALAQAQELGYAEPDPEADVEGDDAAYKLAILASIALGKRIRIEDVYKEGVRGITIADIEYARGMGYVVKLLAIAKNVNERAELRVHPALLPEEHPLAAVKYEFNAVLVRGDAAGDVMLYGRGAGALPTGTAVVGDIISIARNIVSNATGRVVCSCRGEATAVPIGEVESRRYVRMTVKDQPGVMGKIATIFGEEGVSLNSVIQQESRGASAEIVWVTHKVAESRFARALERIGGLDVVEQAEHVIRVEE